MGLISKNYFEGGSSPSSPFEPSKPSQGAGQPQFKKEQGNSAVLDRKTYASLLALFSHYFNEMKEGGWTLEEYSRTQAALPLLSESADEASDLAENLAELGADLPEPVHRLIEDYYVLMAAARKFIRELSLNSN